MLSEDTLTCLVRVGGVVQKKGFSYISELAIEKGRRCTNASANEVFAYETAVTSYTHTHTESPQVRNPIRPHNSTSPSKTEPSATRVVGAITLHCLMKPFPLPPRVPFNPRLLLSQSLSLANRPTVTDVDKISLIKSSCQSDVMKGTENHFWRLSQNK